MARVNPSAAEIAKALGGYYAGNDGWSNCKCPVRDHKNPSPLGLKDEADGRLRVNCKALCDQESVFQALEDLGLYERPRSKGRRANGDAQIVQPIAADAPSPLLTRHYKLGTPSRVWAYRDKDGRILSYAARFETPDGKTYRPMTLWQNGADPYWDWSDGPKPWPLYNLPKLLARPDAPVLICEGEKSADGAEKLFPDFVATTTAHGAGSPQHSDFGPVAGRRVVIWPDHDKAGGKYVEGSAPLCMKAGAIGVRIVKVPDDFPDGWDLADDPPEGVSADDLRAMLDAAEEYQPAAEEREPAEEHEPAEEAAKSSNGPEFVLVGGVRKRLTTLTELNRRFALLETSGSATAYVSRADFLLIKDDDLRRRLAGEVVKIGSDKDGHPSYIPAAKFWTEHADRHRYRRIVFTNHTADDETLNLFHGFGVEPRPGLCDLILEHIRDVICAGDEAAFDAMVKLLAWQLQNIGKPSRVIVALKTRAQQAGKGILLENIMGHIYGPSGFIPSSVDQVLGRFNDALVGRAFVFLDEVMFAGDRRAADAIKALATSTRHGIETKGLPIIQCPIAVNFWLASNHENAAHIEEGDARYWVLECSEQRVGDHEYFAALVREMENGGKEAFADYLLNLDVSEFVPFRDAPKNNEAKKGMIRESINPYDARKWLEECCRTGMIGSKEWRTGEEWLFPRLRDAYVEWQKLVKAPVRPEPTKINRLGELLRKAGFPKPKQRWPDMKRYYCLPSIEACLDALGVPALEEAELDNSPRPELWPPEDTPF